MPKRKRGRIRPKTEAIATTGPERKRRRPKRQVAPQASNPADNPEGPKRTPRLSEAEKREGAKKRRARVDRAGVIHVDEEGTDREYQRLADDEVKRSSAVVRATPRDVFFRAREARDARRRRRKAAGAVGQDRGRAVSQPMTPLTAKRRKRKN
jgi:hypothetical protein